MSRIEQIIDGILYGVAPRPTPTEPKRAKKSVRQTRQADVEQRSRAKKNQASLSNQLRQAIKGSGLTMYRIAKESGVPQTILSRFLTGEHNMHLETAEKLASYFGMSLTPPKKPRA
jgi:ribosome-binding protein aMBF1 (putative translation factor)